MKLKFSKEKIILCVVGTLAIILVGFLLYRTYLRCRIVATIPSPETFFDQSAEIEKSTNGNKRKVSYSFDFDEDPSDAVQAYVELLNSSAYPFYIQRQSDYDNIEYYFCYNGGKSYLDSSLNEIVVINYGNDYYTYKDLWVVEIQVWNSSNFNVVSAETYDWDNNGVTVADNDTGDGTDDDANKDTMAATAEDDFTSSEMEEEETTPATTIDISTEEEASVDDSEQQEAETISYNSNSVLLPDVGEFLRCGRGEDMAYRDSGHLISYSFSIDDGRECIDEVIELLLNESYQLSLYNIEDSNYVSTSATLFSSYFFSYDGDNGVIEEVEDGYDVRVLVGYYYGQGRIGLSIYYDSDFEVIDPVVRAENKPTDYSGNPIDGTDTNTWDGTYIPEFAQKDCLICHGDKDCQTCGGDGYLWSSASGKEDRNCWRCQSNVGKCWACNGTGKQQY